MIRKTIILVLLAAFAAIATEALSQSPGAVTSPGPSATKTPPSAEKSPPVASPAPSKAESTKPSSKDSSSKTFPTSSQPASPGAGSVRRELVVERASVTLIDDNMVPATEAGMLTAIPVKEGHIVEKNDQVAEIDTRSTLAKQHIAEAEHAAATAQAENEAEIEVAEKAIEVSKADLDANEEIKKANPRAVSASEHRKFLFQWQKSVAQKKQAINEKKIAGLTANAKKAQLDAATIEIDLRQIRAPFNGQVVEVMKNVGDWVTVGEPIMHIVGLDKVRVKGYVFVNEAEGASYDEVIHKPVTITVDAPGGKKYTVKGIIGFASPVIEGLGSQRQYRIWAEVDNEKTIDPITKQESWKIQPGSMATMTIDLTPPKPVAAAKTDPKVGKGKVDAFKPVTGEADKAGTKKSSAKER